MTLKFIFSINFSFHLSLCGCVSCSVLSDSLWPPQIVAPQGPLVHGSLQARILEWVPFPSPGGLTDPGNEPRSLGLLMDSLPSELSGKPLWMVFYKTAFLFYFQSLWMFYLLRNKTYLNCLGRAVSWLKV